MKMKALRTKKKNEGTSYLLQFKTTLVTARNRADTVENRHETGRKQRRN